MSRPTLVIGNKNYSSWSLRPWIFMTHHDLSFEEIRIPLDLDTTPARLRELSPTGKVPVLIHEGQTIHESLAICEYVSETFLDGRGWPADRVQRAAARAVSCEMHAGFNNLRNAWPMNTRLRRKLVPDDGVQRDITRIENLWHDCLVASGGPWLFGDFSIADAMFAPVALRFYSYEPQLETASERYVASMLAHPGIVRWMAAGRTEVEVIRQDEVGYLLGEPGWD